MTANTNTLIITMAAELLAEEEAELTRKWHVFNKRVDKTEKAFVPKLITAFEKQQSAVLSAMSGKPVPDTSGAEKAVQKQESEAAEAAAESYVNGIFKLGVWVPAFEEVGRPFITLAYKEGGQAAYTEIGLEAAFNVTNPRAKAILKKRVFKFSDEVNKTTQRKLRKTLAKGFDIGESITQISQRVADVFEIAKGSRTKMIAQTEILGASNQANHEGYIESGIVETKIWINSRDARVRDTHTIDGQERKLNERYSNGLLHPHDPGGPAGEVINCFIGARVPIFTDHGWKPIGKIEIGDKVLTHLNRFKPVTRVLDGKPYGDDVVKIMLPNAHRAITTTPEHSVLMSDGEWRDMQDIVAGEAVKVMASYCRRCHKPIPYWNKYCSFSCNSKDITDRQWSDPEHRKNMSAKTSAQLKREYADGTRDPMTIAVKAREVGRAKYGIGGYMGYIANDPEFQRKARQAIVDKYGSTLECLKQGAFKAMGKASWEGSSLERAMKRYLDSQDKEYVQQFWIGRRRADFYLEAEKLFIECDSEAFHSDKEKDRKRDLEVLMQYPDHQIAHVFFGDSVPRWEFFDLTQLNHTGSFGQVDVIVKQVERWKLKQPRRLYNFAVENDESYLACGIVVHNCRCTEAAGKLKEAA